MNKNSDRSSNDLNSKFRRGFIEVRYSFQGINYLPLLSRVSMELLCWLWHSRLWSFQGRDTELQSFLAINQLYSNEIIEFSKLV
jgi:hypothetical protein